MSAWAQIPSQEAKNPILVPGEHGHTEEEDIGLKDLNATLGGIFRMWAIVPLKPSAEEYQTQFKVPQIDLVMNMAPAKNIKGHLEFAAGPTRDGTSDQWDMMVAMAYVEFERTFGTDIGVRYGLVPNIWVENQATLVDLEFSSRTSKNFLGRYGYSDTSDQGVSIQEDQDIYGWSLAVVNGEGEKSDETGYGKEGRLFLRWSPLSDWREEEKNFSVMAQWTEGSYTNVGPESTKRRLQLLAKLDQDVSWGAQAEVFWGVDPVDAINGVVADSVDLTDRGGEVAHSFGYSARLYYSWRDAVKSVRKYQVFARYDSLDPMRSADDRGLVSYLLGFSYFPARNLQFSLAMSQVDYQVNHASAVGDAQEINFATILGF